MLGSRLLAALSLLSLAWLLPGAGLAATQIEEIRTPGGLTAWLVHEPAVPVIAVSLSFAGGGALDPVGRKGVANMVSGLLDEGAGELDALAFQTRLDELAIRLGFDADRDGFYASMRTLSERRTEAFRLLSLALNQPRFDPEPLERVRGQILNNLKRAERDPNSIAGRTWFKLAFAGHPYALPNAGTQETVKAITAADLRAYTGRVFTRAGMKIGVVGDITAAELAPLLDAAFAALPAGTASHALPDAVPAAVARIEVVDLDIPQSRVIFGGPGIKRDDPDWYAAYVMNYVLGGGGLTSRLTEEVRERRGLAYSVYSYLLPLDHVGLHMGGVGTQNARVAEALQVIRDEIGRLREEGITALELADAKTYLNGSFPLRLTSSGRIARLLVAMQRQDLGIDYLTRRPELIDAVTLEDVQRVARRLLDPEAMFVVVVGKPEGLKGGG